MKGRRKKWRKERRNEEKKEEMKEETKKETKKEGSKFSWCELDIKSRDEKKNGRQDEREDLKNGEKKKE